MKIRIIDSSCTGPQFNTIQTGDKYTDGVTCNICECRKSGTVYCYYYRTCAELDCHNGDEFEKNCCDELKCFGNSDLPDDESQVQNDQPLMKLDIIHDKEQNYQENLNPTANLGVQQSQKFIVSIILLICLGIFTIAITFFVVKKKANNSNRTLSPWPLQYFVMHYFIANKHA